MAKTFWEHKREHLAGILSRTTKKQICRWVGIIKEMIEECDVAISHQIGRTISIGRIRLFWHGYKDIRFSWRTSAFVKYFKPTCLEFKGKPVRRILWICGLSISY